MIEDQDQTSLVQDDVFSPAFNQIPSLHPFYELFDPSLIRPHLVHYEPWRSLYTTSESSGYPCKQRNSRSTSPNLKNCALLESQGRAAEWKGCIPIYSCCLECWNGGRHRSFTIRPCPRPNLRNDCLGRVKRTVMS
jgi:hypothetical protein